MTTNEITIKRVKDYYEVTANGESSGPLCLGELLEQVISLTHPQITKPAYTEGRHN